MSRKNDDRHTIWENMEAAFYILLPLLCAAAILRGCRTWNTPSEGSQQTASGQQLMMREQDESDAPAPEESVGTKAEEKEEEQAGGGSGPAGSAKRAAGEEKGASSSKKDTEPRRHPYDDDKFAYSEETGHMSYSDENYESLPGIDVSDHQGEIDWEEVAGAGYKFVFVRVGFRGYGDEGTLNEDTMAVQYMKEAKKAGLQVGAYFFSQAVNEEEAAEEARFAAEIIRKAGTGLDLPLVYDPELAGGSAGRANDLDRDQASANALAFKKAAEKELSCKVALYTNLYWENTYFDVETLNQFEIWYADYEPTPQTSYQFTWWQYTENGSVPGIKGKMDLNLWIKRTD